MTREAQLFLLAVQFLTRLPVPRDLPFTDERLTEATKYYPAVGVVVGALGAVVLWAASLAWPGLVAVLVSMVATIWATGAFHEDGLADAADGLGGGMTRDRALEIMRDSRIGTYGAVTLGLTLALKAAALSALPVWVAGLLLVTGHGLSRFAPVLVVARASYAREEGAKFVAPSIAPGGLRVAVASAGLLAVTLLLALGPIPTFLGLVTGAGAAALFARLYLRKLGGYTGDCLGGTQQMAELGLYLGVLAALGQGLSQ